ncbi:MAG: hypothetical protein PHY93_10770 [Bacteriovorax sp.]|nr:hypothetical protein [Bacteriovorax sp.]
MKFQAIILGLTFLISSSCTPAKYLSTKFNGGVDGGGGEILKVKEVTNKEVEEVIAKKAKPALSLFFIGNEKFINSNKEEYQNLYPQIYSLLASTSIEVRMDRPCYDHEGKQKDGSIYASSPNTICISPFLMSPKLNQFTYEAEIFGLIAHELSHLAGFDENEAIMLQNDVTDTYVNNGHGSRKVEFEKYSMTLRNIISRMENPLTLETWDGSYFTSDLLRDIFNVENDLQNNSNINIITPSETELVNVEYLRIRTLGEYQTSIDSFVPAWVKTSTTTHLNNIFKGEDSITAYSYFLRKGRTPSEKLKEIFFVNPRNMVIAKNEFRISKNFLSELALKINERSSSQFSLIK